MKLLLNCEQSVSSTLLSQLTVTLRILMWLYLSRELGPGEPQIADLLARQAAKRRRSFPTKRAALESFASRPPFKAFNTESLTLYVEHGFQNLAGTLTYLLEETR